MIQKKVRPKVSYSAVDIAKWLLSYVVIMIHSCPNENFKHWGAIAVPCFFIFSGYFIGEKFKETSSWEMKEAIIQHQLNKAFKLYIVWTIIYLPLTIIGFIHSDESALMSTIIFFRNLLLVGENWMSWPLWYMLALIVALFLFKIGIKLRLKSWHFGLVALCLLGIGYLIENTHELTLTSYYIKVFMTTRNGFFVGFPCLILGFLVHKLKAINAPYVILIVSLSMPLLIAAHS